jgi:hypothetical protein
MVLSSWISPIKKLWLPTLLSFSTSYGESNQLGRPVRSHYILSYDPFLYEYIIV